jgi:hypothetical protein
MATLAVIRSQRMAAGFLASAMTTALHAGDRHNLLMCKRCNERQPTIIVAARMAGFAKFRREWMRGQFIWRIGHTVVTTSVIAAPSERMAPGNGQPATGAMA